MRTLLLLFFLITSAAAADQHPAAVVLQKALNDKSIVGAQLVVGTAREITGEWNVGATSPDGRRAVDNQTRFCVGSVSKPITAAGMLIVADNRSIPLDKPVSAWLPAFDTLKLRNGDPATRAPTLTELLAHRGGLYSQKLQLTPEQTSAIRDFRNTLASSADQIARQPLLSQPGSAYDYSGAGYCVAGRVLEVATGESFEHLMQASLFKPAAMTRTTFFPDPADPNLAVGGTTGPRRPGDAPHLASPFRLTLVGGSLYTTARDMGAFSQMVLNKGQAGNVTVESASVWQRSLSQPFDNPSYGYGWMLKGRPAATFASHSGALFTYRAFLAIDLEHDRFLAAAWTIPDTADKDTATPLGQELQAAWQSAQ